MFVIYKPAPLLVPLLICIKGVAPHIGLKLLLQNFCVGEICVYSQFEREISNIATLLIFCNKFHHFERFRIHLQRVLINKMFYNLFIKSRPLNLGGLITVRFWLYCKIFRIPTFKEVLLKIVSHQRLLFTYIWPSNSNIAIELVLSLDLCSHNKNKTTDDCSRILTFHCIQYVTIIK